MTSQSAENVSHDPTGERHAARARAERVLEACDHVITPTWLPTGGGPAGACLSCLTAVLVAVTEEARRAERDMCITAQCPRCAAGDQLRPQSECIEAGHVGADYVGGFCHGFGSGHIRCLAIAIQELDA